MSAPLASLPPDQRAVLQLILKQGRGYADLSGILKIDEQAVRARAHAGLETLGDGSGQALTPQRRAQVADYLLGQQDGAERDATRTYLDDSAAARRWAGALRAQLEPVARDPLPDVPASTNGHAAEPAAEPLAVAGGAEPPAAEPALAASAPPRRERSLPRPRPAPAPARASSSAPARSSSKLGGIVLLVGLAVLVAVLAIVLIGGGDDDEPSSSSPAAQTQAGSGRTTGSGGATAPQVLAQVNLNATAAGGDAVGIGWVQRVDGRPMIAVQVQRIAPNGESDVYAAWLGRTGGGARFLGFVPSQVGRGRTFTVSASLPGDIAGYDEVLITREPITTSSTPTTPRDILLSGALRLRG
jgi:anti-sigma-K factor RskA